MKSSFVQPNPYAFPYLEFSDLANKKLEACNTSFTCSLKDLESIATIFEPIQPISPKQSIPEQIFSFFMDPAICFGDTLMYQQQKKVWLQKFTTAIQNHKITLTILGFPFKVPNPLKTSRTLPDLAELVALIRLEQIAQKVEELSQVPTVLHVVTEDAFARFTDVSKNSATAYAHYLPVMKEQLQLNHLQFTSLGVMESYVENFEEIFSQNFHHMKKLYDQNDKEVTSKVAGAYPIILRIVKPKSTDIPFLMDVYNLSIPTDTLSKKQQDCRVQLEQDGLRSTLEYFSYLQTRDQLNFMEKEFGTNYIPLTVAPKPNRLGIIPINKDVHILPHQGVPVYNRKTNQFTILYYVDLLQHASQYSMVFLEGDKENMPFFYEPQS